jgi:hypothetical protein
MRSAPETETWNVDDTHAKANVQSNGHGWLVIIALTVASLAALLFLVVSAPHDVVAVAGGSILEQQQGVGSQAP